MMSRKLVITCASHYLHGINAIRHLLPNRQEQPIAYIPQPRLQHSAVSDLAINARDPDLTTLTPLLGGPLHSLLGPENRDNHYPLRAPVPQRLDRSGACAARGNDRVHDDGEAGGGGTRGGVGQIVVVLDRFEGEGLAVKAEVVDRDGAREDRLDR